jgi:hypothetical protein
MIKCVVNRENEYKVNGDWFKQETTLAMFELCSNRDFFIILSLTWNKRSIFCFKSLKNMHIMFLCFFKEKKLEVLNENNLNECNCLLDCVYEYNNMIILFHHKQVFKFQNHKVNVHYSH